MIAVAFAFALGLLVGVGVCVLVALIIDRRSKGSKPVVVGMVRNPHITLRFWLDPNYRAVTRDLRRVFGE